MRIPFAYLITVAAILIWALLSVVSRILLLRFGLDPWMFSFLQLVAGGVVLLAWGGHARPDFRSFKRASTWVLGVLRVVSAALYTAVLGLISVLETGIMSGLNLPVVALIVWFVLGHRPARGEWMGHVLVLAAIAGLTLSLEPDLRLSVFGLLALNAVCLAGMNLLAELHPDNSSDDPAARMRFTGAVLLVTALIFLLFRLLQTGQLGGGFDMTLIVASVLVGVFLRAPAMLFAFWGLREVGTQNYTGAITLLPIFGMIFEQLAVALGLLEVSRFNLSTLLLLLPVMAGTLLILFMRSRAKP